MGLNKQKGNMYGFVTHTKNYIKGKCPHDCSYCYMKNYYSEKNPQPELHFDEKELLEDMGSGKFIFVGSSCDMLAQTIPFEWIMKIINHCKKYPNNQYLFQSKNGVGLHGVNIALPKNSTMCITVETNIEKHISKYSGGQPAYSRLRWMETMCYSRPRRMITIEPIMDFDLIEFVGGILRCRPHQVNIGADSGNNHLPEPSKEKIMELISKLEKFTIVHQKQNLRRLL